MIDRTKSLLGLILLIFPDTRLPAPALTRSDVMTALTEIAGCPKNRMNLLIRLISRKINDRPIAKKG